MSTAPQLWLRERLYKSNERSSALDLLTILTYISAKYFLCLSVPSIATLPEELACPPRGKVTNSLFLNVYFTKYLKLQIKLRVGKWLSGSSTSGKNEGTKCCCVQGWPVTIMLIGLQMLKSCMWHAPQALYQNVCLISAFVWPEMCVYNV